MTNFAVLSPWTVSGGCNVDAFTAAFQSLCGGRLPLSCAAQTMPLNVPPNPNLTLLLCQAQDADAATVLADPTWGPLVMWMDGALPSDGVSTDYAAHLATFAALLGGAYTVGVIGSILGTTVNGRSRATIAGQVASFLQSIN